MLGTREVAPQPDVDHRNAVVSQSPTAADALRIGRFGPLAVEILLVGEANVRRDEKDQLPVGLQILKAVVGVVPQVVEELHHLGRIFEVGGLERHVVGLLLRHGRSDGLQKAVESVVAARLGGIADPHRRTDAFGDGLFEKRRLGLFELGARQIVEIDVGPRRNPLVDEREVVGRREPQLGLHTAEIDGLLVFGGGGSSRPSRLRVLLEDVALTVPELHGRGHGHVVEYPHAQFQSGGTAQHGAEEDVFQIGAGVLFGIFQETHNHKVFREPYTVSHPDRACPPPWRRMQIRLFQVLSRKERFILPRGKVHVRPGATTVYAFEVSTR